MADNWQTIYRIRFRQGNLRFDSSFIVFFLKGEADDTSALVLVT